MTTQNCPDDALIPGVAGMNGDFPQRIPYPPGGDDEVGVYGKLTNGQRVSLYLNPKVRAGMHAQSGALLRDGSLDPALREMIIVRVGYWTNSIYEVVQHRSLAARLGVSDAKLDALACLKPSGLDDKEAAAIAFVDELINRNRPGDEALARLRANYDDSQVVELIIVTGNWWMLARMLETAGIPLDKGTIGEKGVVGDSAAAGETKP